MPNQLREMEIPISNLYLDPNNPRYVDVSSGRPISEEHVHEDIVQEKAKRRMLDGPHDVSQLRNSIENIGFLRVDRLVAVELPQEGKFMVIEGNRRLAALKSLIEMENARETDLTPEVRDSVKVVPVLVIDGEDKVLRDHTARILQGVRHVASVKPWGPYQEAQLIALMLNEGKKIPEIKSVLGLSAQRINILRRSFYALEQMRQDAEYSDDAKPGLFSHFDEALKKPEIRTWLGWDDDQNICTSQEHRQLFYGWCIGIVDENGIRQDRKIIDAKDSRRLPALLQNVVQFKRFCEDPSMKLRDMPQMANDDDTGELDWRALLADNLQTLRKIPAVSLAEASIEDVQLLQNTKSVCDTLLHNIPKVKPVGDEP